MVEDGHSGEERDFAFQAHYIKFVDDPDNQPPEADTIFYQAGKTSYDINVSILGDLFVEPDEEFYLDFYDPSNIVIDDNRSVGTILNDDAALGCTPDSILFNEKKSNVYNLNLYSGEFRLEDENPFESRINAIGYNRKDGLIWGYDVIVNDGTISMIARKNGHWVRQMFGPVNGLPAVKYNIGDVDENGLLYLKQGKKSDVYVVNVDAKSPDFLKLESHFVLENCPHFVDWAFHPLDGKLYAVGTNDNILYQIDPQEKRVVAIGSIGADSGGYGSVFFDKNGYFYVVNNESGNIYRIDITDPDHINPAAIRFSHGIVTRYSDGARCNQAYVSEKPVVSFQDRVVVTEGDSGISDINYTIYSDRPLDVERIDLSYRINGGSAGGDDYDSATQAYSITAKPGAVRTYILSLPIIKGDKVTEATENFFIDFHSEDLLILNGENRVEAQIIDNDYNIFNAWDPDNSQEKIKTKIVAEPFELQIAKIDKLGEPVSDGNETDTKIRVVPQSMCNIVPFDGNMSGFVDFNYSTLPQGLYQFNISDAMKEARVQFYWRDGSTVRTSCSSDTFAVRPKRYTLEVPRFVAGEDFNITVKAVDAQGQVVTNFAEDIYTYDINATEIGNGCHLNDGLRLEKHRFENGIALINANYPDIGKLKFQLKELSNAGTEFAKIDADDSGESRFIGSAETLSEEIKPAHISLGWSTHDGDPLHHRTYFNIFTQSPDAAAMKAHLDMNVTVQNALGQPVENFTDGCSYAKDIAISLQMQIDTEDQNGTYRMVARYQDANATVYDTDQIAPMATSLTKGLQNLSYRIEKRFFNAGIGIKKMAFNFSRSTAVAREPMKLVIANPSATLDTLEYADSRSDTLHFFYVRARVPDQEFVGEDGEAPIYYEIYCKKCDQSAYGITGLKESVDSIYWYRIASVDEGDYLDIIDDLGTLNHTMTNQDAISASTRPVLTATDKMGNSVLKISVSKAPFRTRIAYRPKPYLLYNPFNASVSRHYFLADFVPKAKSWAGKGALGGTIDTAIAPRNNTDVIDW